MNSILKLNYVLVNSNFVNQFVTKILLPKQNQNFFFTFFSFDFSPTKMRIICVTIAMDLVNLFDSSIQIKDI